MAGEPDQSAEADYRRLISCAIHMEERLQLASGPIREEIRRIFRILEADRSAYSPHIDMVSVWPTYAGYASRIEEGIPRTEAAAAIDGLRCMGPTVWFRLGEWMATKFEEFPEIWTCLSLLDYTRLLEIEYFTFLCAEAPRPDSNAQPGATGLGSRRRLIMATLAVANHCQSANGVLRREMYQASFKAAGGHGKFEPRSWIADLEEICVGYASRVAEASPIEDLAGAVRELREVSLIACPVLLEWMITNQDRYPEASRYLMLLDYLRFQVVGWLEDGGKRSISLTS